MYRIKARFVYHSGIIEAPYIYGEWVLLAVPLESGLPMRPNTRYPLSHVEFIRSNKDGEEEKGFSYAET